MGTSGIGRWVDLSGMTTRTKILTIVAVVLIVIFILYLFTRVFNRRRDRLHSKHVNGSNSSDSKSSEGERISVEAPKKEESKPQERIEPAAPKPSTPKSNTTEFFGKEYATNYPSPKISLKDGVRPEWPEGARRVATTDSKPRAPILRCYDFFEFPGDGAFHVKTCGTQSKSATVDVAKPGSFTPTRIFVQWFPVEGAKQYTIYCNYGMNVSTDNNDKTTDLTAGYFQKWAVSGGSYYYETEPMITDPKNGRGCFSVVVTASNDDGVESPASKIFSTCG